MSETSSLINTSSNGNTLTTTDQKSIQTLVNNIPASSLMVIFGLVAAVGNLLIIIVVAKNKYIQTKCYFLIANLSIADFLVGE